MSSLSRASRARGDWRSTKRQSLKTLGKLCLISATILGLHVTLLHYSNLPPSQARLVGLSRRSFGTGERSFDHGGEAAPGGGIVDWNAVWQSASPQLRPVLFLLMCCWLIFLFAFVGITASDFFCPNLSTIASRLGLSESVAGVTFLAFSNGSPDVFSTFAALRSDSGALAIGELIGAASFIVSVVAGTMCIIQPFKVSRYTFLRDVGFFTLAVSFTISILWDGHIHLWESLLMVALYVVYACIVGFGSWYRSARDQRREAVRSARSEYAVEEYRDEPDAPPTHSRNSSIAPPPGPPRLTLSREASGASTPTIGSRSYAFPHAFGEDDEFDTGAGVTLIRARSSSQAPHSPLGRRPAQRSSVRPSLLGAIEFRDVVNSLSADSTARSLSIFSAGADDTHSHYFSQRSPNHSTAVSPGTSRPRATTFSGTQANPAHPSLADHRRPTWAHATADDAATATATAKYSPKLDQGGTAATARDPWADESDSDDDEARQGLVDLSAGVDNPWQASTSSPRQNPPLRVTIPSFSSSATSARTARSRGATSPALSPDPRSRSSSPPPRRKIRRMPSILLTTEEGDNVTVLPPSTLPPPLVPWTKRRPARIASAVFVALFPSLEEWEAKSWLGRGTAVLCVPAILLLNLTLPVVDTDQDDCDSYLEKEEEEAAEGEYSDDVSEGATREEGPLEGFLIDTGDSTPTPSHPHSHRRPSESSDDFDARQARETVAHEFHSHVQPHHSHAHSSADPGAWPSNPTQSARMDRFDYASSDAGANKVPQTREPSEATASPRARELSTESEFVPEVVDSEVLTRWLTVVQCVLGPVFITTAVFADNLRWWQPLSALLVGLALAGFSYWCFESSKHPGRIVLCFVGFLVAMVWIMCIVNEVVAVLQTFGHIFGLSDAILGLTIFAMGNSLGDLVANATVARMGFPSMAIAACFGGPMLNILLGVGLSGTYLIGTNGGEPLDVHIGRTLLVSGAGLLAVLLATLVAVPLSGFWMGRRVGWALIAAYSVVLTINVVVEVTL